MSKIVAGELEIPCPYCTDGFTTAGDRHARTRQDVCGHCGGTGKAPAGTGKTAATSAPPLPSTETMVATARIDRIERQMQEHGGVDAVDLEWMAKGVRQAIAAGCAKPAPIPLPLGTELAPLPKPLTIEILMHIAYDAGHVVGQCAPAPFTGSAKTYLERRRETVAELIANVEKAGHMPEVKS